MNTSGIMLLTWKQELTWQNMSGWCDKSADLAQEVGRGDMENILLDN